MGWMFRSMFTDQTFQHGENLLIIKTIIYTLCVIFFSLLQPNFFSIFLLDVSADIK